LLWRNKIAAQHQEGSVISRFDRPLRLGYNNTNREECTHGD